MQVKVSRILDARSPGLLGAKIELQAAPGRVKIDPWGFSLKQKADLGSGGGGALLVPKWGAQGGGAPLGFSSQFRCIKHFVTGCHT